ncbi:MAG TPA: MMPL family transporter [Candidatus Tectomicrobia bacterium]|nr:MMPL family transporter [Candidatus Tectomicrobia bacterium]
MAWKKLHAEGLYQLFVGMALRHPYAVIGVALFGIVLSLFLSTTRLEFHTSHLDLVSSGNRYKQLDRMFSHEFDVVPERVIVVIRSQDTARAQAFATALAMRLEDDQNIDTVLYRIPLESLRDKALLYLSEDELSDLQQKLRQHQDVLHEFAALPTLENLVTLINRETTEALVGHVFTGFLADEKATEASFDLTFLRTILQHLNRSLDPQQPYHSLWQALLTWTTDTSSPDGFLWSDDRQLLFVLANPKADAGEFNPFGRAVQQMRRDVRELQRAYPGVEVGITGKAVLETDEMAAAQRDMTRATLISLAGVAVLFIVFFRGVTRPGLTVLTLMLGVGWALGFTTLTIGHLNIFTIVFVPMLIGLGIDSTGIHFLTHYEAERAVGKDVRQALERTFAGTGAGIVTATLTTATAFLALTLSDFLGLRELGFITGSGLLLILLATFTCLPALLVLEERWGRPRTLMSKALHVGEGGGRVARLYRYPWTTLAVSVFFVMLSVLALGKVGTDFNLLRLQSERNESVIWAQKIFESTRRSVLMGELMADSLEEVEGKVAALSRLSSVEKVDSILSILPRDQDRKRALIRELRPILGDFSLQAPETEAVDIAALRATLQRLNAKLEADDTVAQTAAEEVSRQDLRELQQLIELFLHRTWQMPAAETQAALVAFQRALRSDLTDKLATLRRNLEAEPLRIQDLPHELQTRYVGKTGKFRLFVFPAENVWEPQPLARFVRDLQTVDADALGAPVTNFEYMETIKAGYHKASIYAMGGIVFLSLLMFRGALVTVLALVPLVVGSVWTLGLMGLFGVQFNMANLLFVPLIIGIGIDNGVHIVHSFRATEKYRGESVPLGRSTAKAVTLAALTAIVGFGSLMISSHHGIYSLGLLVSLGVGSVLLASLTTLPSLLAIFGSTGGAHPASRPYQATAFSPMSQRVHS